MTWGYFRSRGGGSSSPPIIPDDTVVSTDSPGMNMNWIFELSFGRVVQTDLSISLTDSDFSIVAISAVTLLLSSVDVTTDLVDKNTMQMSSIEDEIGLTIDKLLDFSSAREATTEISATYVVEDDMNISLSNDNSNDIVTDDMVLLLTNTYTIEINSAEVSITGSYTFGQGWVYIATLVDGVSWSLETIVQGAYVANEITTDQIAPSNGSTPTMRTSYEVEVS